jgi:hypothetical protein
LFFFLCIFDKDLVFITRTPEAKLYPGLFDVVVVVVVETRLNFGHRRQVSICVIASRQKIVGATCGALAGGKSVKLNRVPQQHTHPHISSSNSNSSSSSQIGGTAPWK